MYGWFTSLSNTVNAPVGTIKTDLDFSDILDDLEIAFMGAFEAHHNGWSLIGDLVYADLSSEKATPGPVFNSAKADTEMTIVSGYAIYRVFDTADAAVDIGGGLRWYDINIDVGLTGGPVPGKRSFSEDWVDPVVAARLIVPLGGGWSAAGFADIGGFGIGDASDPSWQVLASVAYDFNDTWSARFGYRYLSIDKKIGGSDVDLELYGPMLGVTARF